MNCLRNIRNLALRFDLFAATPTLRVNGEPDYEHVCCGIFSLVLILSFVGIFAQQTLNVLQKTQIQAKVLIDDQTADQTSITDIRFALGIDKVKIGDVSQYFDISLKTVTRNLSSPSGIFTPIQLQFCTQETWNSYGSNFQQYFQAYSIHELYCVPDDVNLSLFGYEGSDTQFYLQLRVQKCRNRTDCANETEIVNFIDSQIIENDYVNVRLLFMNTILSPQHSQVSKKTLQKDIFLTFGKTTGTRGKITLGRYYVSTDESIWPFQIIQEEHGHYIQSFKTNSIQLSSDHYVVLQISKSTVVLEVQRHHNKIDDLLSYIGGLFALVFSVLFFFIAPFNQYRYQLMVAENSFSYDEHGKRVREKDLTIWLYVKYAFYDMIKMLGCSPDWQDMKKIDEARQQANQQLDIKTIMKKLRHFQRLSSLLMDEYLLVSSQLMKPLTIQQSKRKRKILSYYDKVMKNILTDEELNTVYDTLQLFSKKDILPIAQQRTMEELKQAKCQVDEYDSEDEEAENYIYDKYLQLRIDSSERATLIMNSIPRYVKIRMQNRMKENVDFINLDI